MFYVVAMALCACALAPATAAHAAPTWQKIVAAPGRIYDVDANRVLFRKSDNQLGVMDRHTEAVTLIPAVPARAARFGRLTPHGALVAVTAETGPSVFEWRDGVLIHRGSGFVLSLSVAGSHAAWSASPSFSDPPSVFHLDLDTGVATQIATDARSEDAAANGDVVYESGGHSIMRWRAGSTEMLAAGSSSAWEADPRTDGINVVWREGPACDCDGSRAIRGYGPAGPLMLSSTTRESTISPERDYRVAGGWIALTRGEAQAETIWVREPGGTETPASDVGEYDISALSDTGEVIFSSGPAYQLTAPGADRIPVGFPGAVSVNRTGHTNYLFHVGSRWYGAIDDSIVRLALTEEPTDGGETAIDSAPEGSVNSTSATFDFSSSVAGATFQTKLDDAGWQPTSNTSEAYAGLTEGAHTFLVRAVEPGGELDTEPASQMWTVDTIAPTVTLGPPAGAEGTTSDSTPAFQGTAGAGAGDGQQVTVRVYSGTAASGTPAETVTADRNQAGGWSTVASPPLPDGTFTAQASQQDAAGNTGSSGVRTFVVDATPPEPFALRSPAEGAQNVPPSIELSWDATGDATTGVAGYELWVDGSKNRDVPTSACSAGSCAAGPEPALADGAHSWQVKAVDGAGNVRESAARNFTVDAAPPAAFGLLSPSDGARTGDSTPALTWEAARDAGAGVDHYDVWVDGAGVGTGVTGTEFTVGTALIDGQHDWHVDAIDGAGNARSTAGRIFVVDTTPPEAHAEALHNQVLTGDTVQLFGGASRDDRDGTIVRYEWDLDGDGDFERDTGANATTSTTYATARDFEAGLRVTDSVGHTDSDTVPLFVRPRPPSGLPGVSIEDGAQFTDDPHVTVDVVWTPFASDLVISNDGGFQPASTRPVDSRISWTLDSSGPERIPKTIYVRFLGGDGGRETYQDDIILDETAPAVLSARFLRGGSRAVRRVRVVVRDRVSGVTRMQVALNRSLPARTIRYRRVVRVVVGHSRPFVRVRDRAGNWSRWKRVARR